MIYAKLAPGMELHKANNIPDNYIHMVDCFFIKPEIKKTMQQYSIDVGSLYRESSVEELKAWLRSVDISFYVIQSSEIVTSFLFVNEEDVVAFKMRWL
jgi:hypothetical protein